jgi:hypothetical protein
MLEKINQVNELLHAGGKAVIQQIKIGKKPVLYGYKPQYVIDAVNTVFNPENWRYELHKTEIFTTGDDTQSGQVVASVEVFLRGGTEAEFVSHGVQFGQATIVYGNVGDAKKGAVTDGIGKGLSLFSIGKHAYRGELGAVFNGNATPSKPSQLKAVPDKSQPSNDPVPSQPKQDENGLPKLPNVKYETSEDGTVLAIGDTYNNRSLLKSCGFTWFPKLKAWGLKKAA